MESKGAILWQGPSVLDGAPIVLLAAGLGRPSSNRKTGPMVQTYALRADQAPTDAVRSGADASICGACPLRGDGFKGRRCYVRVEQGPRQVWESWRAGKYADWTGAREWNSGEFWGGGQGKTVRLGAYGDPAAVPTRVWGSLLCSASGWTGYTHQWRHPNFDPEILAWCMASCDSRLDVHALLTRYPEARYFRVREPGGEMLLKEVDCPAMGDGKVTCSKCRLCSGIDGKGERSASIERHGQWARMGA